MTRTLIDSNALIYLIDKRTSKPLADRMRGLLQKIESSRGKLIIPVQAIGEYLSGAGAAGQAILSRLQANRNVEIVSFDHIAATECAFMERTANEAGNKRGPLGRDVKWQKVKVDRQIVAIARVRSVDLIVSSDEDITKLAKALEIPCMRVEDLPLPEWAQQIHIDEVLAIPAQEHEVSQKVGTPPLVIARTTPPNN